MNRHSLLLLLVVTIFSGCTHGLEPLPYNSQQTGFGGTVRFTSAWPPADSVYDIRVVAFYNYPPQNIYVEVLTGQAMIYPAIGPGSAPKLFVDSLAYRFTLDSASTFRYVVVAMQYGPDVTSDWKVVGAYGYSHGAGSPKSVVIPQNSFINGINIDVDFQNVPPTPGVSRPAHTPEPGRVADQADGHSQIR